MFEHIRLNNREQQVVDLLLQGCENEEIAKELGIAERTVKAHFKRMFLRFAISDGFKRVKLATLLYRRQKWQEQNSTEAVNSAHTNRRVIELVAEGLKNKDVAVAIGTTEHVVKNYLRVIFDKLGVWNRVELALWYEARRFDAASAVGGSVGTAPA